MSKRIPKIITRQVHDSDSEFGYLGELLVDGERIFACGGTHGRSTMLVTNDGGASWDRRTTPATPGLRQMHREPGALYVTGEYGMLAVSVDSALTWTKIPVDTTQCLFQLHRELDGTWWAVGDGGVVFRSYDGVTYKQVDTDWDTRLLGVTSLNNAVHIFGYDGTIRKWNGSTLEQVADLDRAITQILVTKTGSWIVIGDSALAFRSTDSGTSFEPIDVPTDGDLEAMIGLPQGILVVGADGTLLLSDDDGVTFERVPNDMTGHLWSITLFGETLFIGGDDGAIWQLAISTTQTMMSEDKPDDDDDDDDDDDEEDEDDDEAEAPASFDSIEEASERWIREGTAFSAALNDYVRRVYAVGPNKAGDEPEETRGDMAAYVRDKLVALNESGEHRLARELFPPAYEPFDYDGLGQEITQLAYLADSRVVARIGDSMYFVERDRITAIDDLIFFGQSADRRYVAKGYADRIAIHRGWDGPVERTFRHPVAGVKSLAVTPDGDGAIAATEGGVYWLTERSKRLMLGDGDSVSYAHAAMSPNGRFVAMGTQDSPHLLLDRKSGRRYQFDPVSSYPHFAAFHADRPEAILSSCHGLYGSGSLAVNLDVLIADGKEPARPINRTAWVYAVASTPSGYLLADRNGYVWAIDFTGEQQWYCFVGSTLTALDLSPDRKRILVGSFAGYVIELALAAEGDPRLLTNGPVKELGRWVFWLGHEPMIW